MSEPFQPGQTVVGSFEFTKTISQSATFLWLLASNPQDRTSVIIQVLNPAQDWKEYEIERLIDYFDGLQGVRRAGLWTPVQVISDKNCPIALIYSDEETIPLFSAINDEAHSAAALWKQAAELLHHLHNRGLHHGLVSPESFVLIRGKVHLTGFGYEPLLHLKHPAAFEDGGVFLAPETSSEGAVSNASDIFGYAMTVASWMPKCRDSDWFERACCPRPSDRYQRARQMFDGYEAFFTKIEEPPPDLFAVSCLVTPTNGGEIIGAGQYIKNERISMKAVPAESFEFVRWEGQCEGDENPLSLQINENITAVGVFRKVIPRKGGLVFKHHLVASSIPLDGGVVKGTGSVASGKEVRVEAMAHEAYKFARWSGDLEGTENPAMVLVDGDKQIHAHFEKISQLALELICDPPGRGVVDGSGYFRPGTTAEVRAKPSRNWRFSHWSGDLKGSTNPIKLILDEDKRATAHFVRPVASLTATHDPPEGGQVEGSGSYQIGDCVTLTAVPKEGWRFKEWSGGVGMFFKATNPLPVNLSNNVSVCAHFVESDSAESLKKSAPRLELATLSTPELGGCVRGAGHFELGAMVDVEAIPANGWLFDHWAGDISTFEAKTTPLQIKLDRNKTVTAHFIKADDTPPSSPISKQKPKETIAPEKRIGGAFQP